MIKATDGDTVIERIDRLKEKMEELGAEAQLREEQPPQDKSLVNSLLDSVKGDRQMSFNSFRYRLLHWCFGINPKTPAESNLPKMLYTHYCPLFHLTNLIAIFSPIILMCKIFYVTAILLSYKVTLALLKALDKITDPIAEWVVERKAQNESIRQQRKLERMSARELELEAQRTQISMMTPEEVAYQADFEAAKWIPRFVRGNDAYAESFRMFWEEEGHSFVYLKRDKAKEFWEKYTDRLRAERKAEKELAERRKQKMRAWLVFWVNFSRVFVKLTLNLFYTALFALVAYLTIFYGIPATIAVGAFIAWAAMQIWSVEWWETTKFIAVITFYALMTVGTIASVGWLTYKAGRKANVPFNWMWEKTLPPRV